MNRPIAIVGSMAGLLAIAACSEPVSEATMKEQARVATAQALKLDPATAAIEVGRVERGATSSNWDAHYDGNSLSCSGNEKFQLPDCRIDTETASN